MKLILKISQKQFGVFKLDAIKDAKDDYYDGVRGNRFVYSHQSDARYANREAEFIKRIKEIKVKPFPFSIFMSLQNNTWGNFGLDEIAPNMDWTIRTQRGYIIDHEHQLYAYASCAGNFEGVYQENGGYFYFYNGSRHWKNLEYLSDCEVVLYETTAPKDMKFWERQSDYLIRKGASFTAQYIAEHGENSQSVSNAKHYFYQKIGTQAFNKMPARATLSGQDPEQYILRKYRNKRLIIDKFDNKDEIAWSMLSDDVKERILKYA